MRRGWHGGAGCARAADRPRQTRQVPSGGERTGRRARDPDPGTGPAARRRTRSLPVALLELLARSAPTRLISARQLAWRSSRSRPAVPARSGRGGRAPASRLRRLRLLVLLGLFGGSDSHSQDCLCDSACDARFHFFKESVRLALVGDERVLLAVAAEIDALAQLLHRGEVLDPVRVDGAEEDPTLDGARQLLAELLFAGLVRLLDDLCDPIAQVILIAELAEARGGKVGSIEHRPERRRELVKVPVLGVRVRRRRIDKTVRLLPQELENGLADVAFLEDEPALPVD